jgi:hypothetical protein
LHASLASAIMPRVKPHRRCRVLLAIALAVVGTLAGPAHAERGRWYRDDTAQAPYAPHSAADQRRVSIEQAIENVQRATGGKVLDAREADGGYRIKVITRRGEVRVVHVDARTGAMR